MGGKYLTVPHQQIHEKKKKTALSLVFFLLAEGKDGRRKRKTHLQATTRFAPTQYLQGAAARSASAH